MVLRKSAKRAAAFMLSLAMVFTGVPAEVFGEGPAYDMADGTLTIAADGDYIVTGTGTEGDQIIVNAGLRATLTLSDAEINGGQNPGVLVKDGAVLDLILEGSNQVKSGGNTAVALEGTAQVRIDGVGSLFAQGGTISYGAGIGDLKSTSRSEAKVTIDGGTIQANAGMRGAGIGGVYNASPSCQITINGGTVVAEGGSSAGAGIGIGAANKKMGKIEINGGNISARSLAKNFAGIGGMSSYDPAGGIVINGGSLFDGTSGHTAVQGANRGQVVDSNGEAVAPVKLSLDGVMKGTRVSMEHSDGTIWNAVTEDDGALYSFSKLGVHSVIAAYAQDVLYYAENVEVEADGSTTVILNEYSGPDCVCAVDNTGVEFSGGTIELNPAQASKTQTLKAVYRPAEDCAYPIHRVETAYTSDGDPSLVSIDGDQLTVKKGSGDYNFQVTAHVSVLGRSFTTEQTVEYQVVESDAASFDLSTGSLVIGKGTSGGATVTKITQQGQEYFLSPSEPVVIVQSGELTSNYIEVAQNVEAKVLKLVDLNIRDPLEGKAPINIFSDTALELCGTNQLSVTLGASNRTAGIRVNMGTLHITGSGVLAISTMGQEPAIGGKDASVFAAGVVLDGGTVRLESINAANQAGIYAQQLLVNGGSLFTKLPAAVRPQRALSGEADAQVYPMIFQAPDRVAEQTAEVRIIEERDSGTPQDVSDDMDTAPRKFSAVTDDAGQLCLWLAEGWNRVKVTVDGHTYFKRIKMEPSLAGNSVTLVENPQVQLEEFQLPSSDIPVFSTPEAMADGSGRLYSKVTLNVSTGVDLSNIEPNVQFTGSECSPQGTVNLAGSSQNGFCFTVIGDGERNSNGARQETIYDVWVGQESSGDKPTTLYAGNRNIVITPGGVLVSGQSLPANPLGYVICGTSQRAHIVLRGDLSQIPVRLRDLEMSPASGSAVRVEGKVLIELEGSNRLTGGETDGPGAGSPAVALVRETGGELTISGSGILKALGGTGAPAFGNGFVGTEGSVAGASVSIVGTYSVGTGTVEFASGNVVASGGAGAPAMGFYAGCTDGNAAMGILKIGAANVHLLNGEGFDPSLGAVPMDSAGRKTVYPIEVTIRKSVDQPVSGRAVTVESYCDGKPRVEVSAVTDENGSVWIWRDNDYWNYTVSGTYSEENSSENVTYFGQAEWVEDEEAFQGVLLKPSEFGGVEIMSNSTAVLTWEKSLLRLKLAGEGLSESTQLVLTPTGPAATGYQILTASAASIGNGEFSASFTMPEALSTTSALKYDVAAIIGSEIRIPTGDGGLLTEIQRPIRPAILGFSIPGQLGETGFGMDSVKGDTVTVQMPYDQSSMELTPVVTMAAAGTDLIPDGAQDFGRNGDWITYSLRFAGPENAWSQNIRTYAVRAVLQKEPRVTALELTDSSGGPLAAPGNALSFRGGRIQVHLTGANLTNVLDSVSQSEERGKYIVTLTPDEAAGSAEVLTAEAVGSPGNAAYTADFEVPDNDSHSSVRTYGISVRASGAIQNGIAAGPKSLTVGIRPDSNTQLLEFALPDQNHSEVTEYATYGSILVEMPTGTNLASMSAVVPAVTLASVTSTYSPRGPVDFTSAAAVSGQADGAGRPVEFTVTALDGAQRTYLVSITVKPAPSSGKHHKKKQEEVTPGAVTGGGINETAMPKWWEGGYINGYDDGTFRPDQTITRGEAAVILSELWRQAGNGDAVVSVEKSRKEASASFRDVSLGFWYENAVNSVWENGLMTGYEDETFRPENNISREEFLTVLTRFGKQISGSAIYGVEAEPKPSGFSDSKEFSKWAEAAVNLACQKDLVQGYEDGTFRPKASVTRAEAIILVNRMLRLDTKLATESKMDYFTDLREDHWAYQDILAAIRTKT